MPLLKNNGGPTFTHALIDSNPGDDAVDAGDPGFVSATLPSDQRGYDRVSGGGVDIGSFELGSAGLPSFDLRAIDPLTVTEGDAGSKTIELLVSPQ